jgi:hypothetical protein
MERAKGLGIAALVLSAVAIVIPLIGIFVAWIGLVCAVDAVRGGERSYSTAAIIVGAVNLLLLSPSLLVLPPLYGTVNVILLLLAAGMLVFAPKRPPP